MSKELLDGALETARGQKAHDSEGDVLLSEGRAARGSMAPTAAGAQPVMAEEDVCLVDALEVLNPKPETQNPKPETQNLKFSPRNPKPEIRDSKSEIQNPKSETRNPEPKTRNPET